MYYHPDINFSSEQILVYLRKSRSDDPTLTVEEVLARHEAILTEWADHHLSAGIPEENIYREVVSGETIDDRPEILRLLRHIESPAIKAVLVVEVQRLSRGDLEDAGRLIKLLRYTNTIVLTPQRIYDLHDEYDRDSFERELKRGNEFLEYQKKIMGRGRLLSVSQGNYLGSLPPYGYDKVFVMDGKRKCPTLAENKEQADVVRMIFDLYVNQDMGYKRICNHLTGLGIRPPHGEQWSPHSLKDLLSNVHYIGKIKWNWRKTVRVVEHSEVINTRPKSHEGDYLVYDGKHKGIISVELFDAAREKMGRNPRIKADRKLRNPLAGLLYCQCGRALSWRTNIRNGVTRSAPRYVCDNQTVCGSGSCVCDDLIRQLVSILEDYIRDFKVQMARNNRDSVATHKNTIKQLESTLQKLERKEISQWEKYAEEGMPKEIFDMLNEKVIQEKEDILLRLKNAYEAVPDPIDYQKKIYMFQDAVDALNDDTAPAEEVNRLLKMCIARITYYRDQSVLLRGTKGKDNGLSVGANWSSSPIKLIVSLRI